MPTRRLVATDQDEQGLIDQRGLVQPIALDLRMDEGPDQITGEAVAPALLRDAGDIGRVFRRCQGRFLEGTLFG